ncbi:MAG: inositol monophosphatase [Fibrobacter sp.]|nr:inositol monophosphatase [Fibrobacter sp.]
MQKKTEIACKAAIEAGRIILSLQGKTSARDKGASYNLVTAADMSAEEKILSCLKESFPETYILSEETFSSQSTGADKLWIIDPLDGTNNFAHSIPQFSVSIAYAEKGEVLAGVVYDPSRDELFTAEKGAGAFLNGKPVRVSSRGSLKESMLSTGFYYERGEMMEKTLGAIYRLFKADIQGIRRMGSAALDLCWTACGRFDGYFEYMLSPWDFAAGALIIKEAGGAFCDRDGLQKGLNGRGVICSNGIIHDELVRLVRYEDYRVPQFKQVSA